MPGPAHSAPNRDPSTRRRGPLPVTILRTTVCASTVLGVVVVALSGGQHGPGMHGALTIGPGDGVGADPTSNVYRP